ncbi:hypothetical protein [uncultured Thiohalocapsa sp.]|uniref:hypothetical protein n=1 Tax=uncultured Thiohalocapsa sp. TaxID=768990 RepID=UPI0025CD1056|nr:hypothetical protein [uncultured Thiohalocapsa sp.]
MSDSSTGARGRHSAFLPVAIGLSALLVLLTSQTLQLLSDRGDLRALHERQEQPMAESQRLREQLEAIASGVRALADDGNASAQRVVQGLARQGISIDARP